MALTINPEFQEALDFQRRITEMLTTAILDDTDLSQSTTGLEDASPETP